MANDPGPMNFDDIDLTDPVAPEGRRPGGPVDGCHAVLDELDYALSRHKFWLRAFGRRLAVGAPCPTPDFFLAADPQSARVLAERVRRDSEVRDAILELALASGGLAEAVTVVTAAQTGFPNFNTAEQIGAQTPFGLASDAYQRALRRLRDALT